MESIQCPHCQKQYAVNDKLRAAVGKRIRCKHCSQPFEIVIQQPSATEGLPTPTNKPEVKVPDKTQADIINEEQTGSNKVKEPEPSKDDHLFSLSTDNSDEPIDDINEDLFKSHAVGENDYSDERTDQPPPPKNTALEPSKTEEQPEEQPEDQKEDQRKDRRKDRRKEPETTTQAVKKTEQTQKKTNIQLIITIVLAITLLISVIAAYLFFAQPNLFKTAPKKEIQSIMPEEMFKPIEIKMPDAKPAAINNKEIHKKVPIIPEKIEINKFSPPSKPIEKAAPKAIFAPSQVCKDIAAEYWVRTHQLATASLDTKTYMKLLDENLEQADDIRSHCKEKTLVSLISKAARTDVKPGWVRKEIYALIDASQAKPEKNRAADLF